MYFDRAQHHIAVRPTCEACQRTIIPGETFRALLSNADSTACEGFTRSFTFPCPGNLPPVQGYILCRKPGCCVCMRSPEAFVVHSDCLKLFYRTCGALNVSRLWTQAAWRNPWYKSPPIGFRSLSSPINVAQFVKAVDGIGIPLVDRDRDRDRLPPEITALLISFCSDSLLSRYVAVLCSSNHISTSQQARTTTYRLSQISQWDRYSKPQLASLRQPIIRISIDWRGIKTLERFPSRSDLNNDYKGCSAFVVADEDILRGFLAIFKDGLLRLHFTRDHGGLQTWDTPRPPALELCQIFTQRPITSQRLRTINLLKATGLTFFCKGGDIFGIHSHTSEMPSAFMEFQKIPKRLRQFIVWMYLPLPQHEQVQGFSLSAFAGLVIRTSSNTFRIGPWTSNLSGKEVTIRATLPIILLYNDPDPGDSISTIGMGLSSKGPSATEDVITFQIPNCPVSQENVYYSLASLEGIRVARVFYGQDARYCKGMLLLYNDGGYQSVGQCGLGAFQEQVFEAPSALYYRSGYSHHGQALDIRFASKSAKNANWVGWASHEMVGTITVWYGYQSIIHLEEQ